MVSSNVVVLDMVFLLREPAVHMIPSESIFHIKQTHRPKMKTSTLERNGVSPQTVELITRLMGLIAWPERRRAMGEVTTALLDGKPRVAENVFGWNRKAVALGIHECQSGIACINDLSARGKPWTEEKHPAMLADIQAIMEPHSESEPSLRTTLLYSRMTASAVREALAQKGWAQADLPSERTLTNILNRQDYRLRTVAKSKVQKKQMRPMPSSPTSGESTTGPMPMHTP